ncbi:hypothetical protein NN3_15010 [Nocardia neocaledoniensis NBRC 108232]|nr:hypothetical protein NN3_15010 [Nocardia neocaledoniensis NBRC 108232]
MGRGRRVEQVDQRGVLVAEQAAPVAGGRAGVVDHRQPDGVGAGGHPALRHIALFGLAEQVDVADDHVRVLGDAAQHAHQPVAEGGDGLGVEQIGGIVPRHGQRTVGGLAHGELDVEFRCARVEVDDIEVETGQRDGAGVGGGGRLEGERHLEQRVVRLRPGGAEHVDEAFERHVGIGEGRQVHLADLVEQFPEARAEIDLAAQHQGVDEHADEVVERTLATARDRGADGDVGAVGQARRPGGQRRVHHHEQRDAARAGDLGQRGVQLGIDREAVQVTGIGGDLGARAVGGQLELIGQIAQLFGPVAELARGHRLRIGLVAEHLALPQRVVGVLHLERRPGGHLAAHALGVGHHHVAQQRAQREAVTADVVHDQHGDVRPLVYAEQGGAEGHLAGDVEVHGGQVDDPCGDLARGDRLGGQREADLVDRHDLLEAGALDLGVEGAQRLVPRHHVGDGGFQCGRVEFTGEPDGDRDVVDGGVVVEAVEEPHPLLGLRERDQLGTRARLERDAPAAAGGGLHAGGQRGHGGGLEQRAQRHLGVERLGQARGDPGGDERVAAELEEIVVETHLTGAEDLGEGGGHDLLHRGDRRLEGARGEHRRGQRLAVELAGGVEREGVEHHERRGHHVHRQFGAQRGLDRVGVDGGAGLRDDVGDQLVAGALVGAHDDHRLRDARLRGERGLDLAQLDAQTAQLHLEVGAAQVFQLAVGGPGDEVTGAVHTLAGRERIGHEAVHGEVGAADVTVGQLHARQIQLTRDTHRNGPQARVQHVEPGVEHGGADRHRVGVGVGDLVIGHVDSGLGGAVQVVHRGAGQLAQALRGRRGQRLT